MISAISRTYDGRDPKLYIQHDADLNMGNSGGALVDENGCLVGINTAIHTQTGQASGFSLAIPMNTVLRALADFSAYGRIDRSYIGVSVQALTNGLETAFGRKDGLLVTAVQRQSPAALAGLQAGDLLLKMDGTALSEPRDLAYVLTQTPSETSISASWVRQDQTMTREIRTNLVETPDTIAIASRGGAIVATRDQSSPTSLGLALTANASALVVNHVLRDSVAAAAGLREGDTILSFDGYTGLDQTIFFQKTTDALQACQTFALLIKRDGNEPQYMVVEPCSSQTIRDAGRRGLDSAAGPY